MTDSETYAWILLSVPESGGKLRDLIAMADVINYAIPTHHELQKSLGWLRSQELVVRKDRSILLTARGTELLSRARSANQTIIRTWEKVTAELESLAGQDAPGRRYRRRGKGSLRCVSAGFSQATSRTAQRERSRT